MMITFNNLGNLGRLANQMFQYASLKGIARNRGFEFMIPPGSAFGTRDLMVRQDGTNIYDIFDLSDNNYGLQVNQVCMERMHTFDEELFNNCPDNVDLLGYYQTHKYFQHIESEIRSDFKFQTDLFETCSDFMKDNFVYRDVISLHVRRGDYVSNPNHPLQTVEYYQRALEMLPNLDVIVFSDDPDWCNSQEIFQPDRFSISESNTVDADLCLMSLCKYHIIANSSLSWWGAWLAKSEKIIAPKNWFGGDCVNKSVSDMEFGDWTWL
jgi:hypothetical protein